MSARGRLGLGAFFAFVGVAAWTVLFVPLGSRYDIATPFGDGSNPPYIGYATLSWEYIERSLRVAALALGVGGLLLMARGWRRGVGLSLGLGLLWFLAEVLVELNPVPWTSAVIAGVVLGVLIAAIAWRCCRNVVAEPARPAWSLLVYGVGAFSFAPDPVNLRLLTDLQGQLSWVAVVLTVMVPACALVAAAAAAWPGPARGRILAGGLVVAGVAGWAGHAWYPVEVSFDSFAWDNNTRALALSAGTALLGAACVALTGAFGRGRWVAARVAGVVAVLLCLRDGGGAAIAVFVPVNQIMGLLERPALPRLVTALALGTAALSATRLLLSARAAVVEPPAGTSPDGRPAGRWRPATGWLLAGVGVAAWTLVAFVAAPSLRGIDGVAAAPASAYVRDLRWAAIALAAGGLLLLARTDWSRAALAAVTAGWFAVDVTVEAVGLQGWPGAATSVVVIIAVVARVTVVGATRGPARPGETSAIIYSGASGLTAIMVGWNADHSTSPLLPAWVGPAGLVLGLLLVVAAVVNALAVAPRVGWGRLGFAVGVTLAGGLAATISYWSSIELGIDWLMFTGPAIGLFAVACVLLAGPVRPPRGWLITGSAVLTAVGGVVAVCGGIVVVARGLLLLGDRVAEATGYSSTLAGVLGGAAVGLLALLPRALSTPDGLPAAPPAPQPLPAPVWKAPLARTDVPETLDWSWRADRTV